MARRRKSPPGHKTKRQRRIEDMSAPAAPTASAASAAPTASAASAAPTASAASAAPTASAASAAPTASADGPEVARRLTQRFDNGLPPIEYDDHWSTRALQLRYSTFKDRFEATDETKKIGELWGEVAEALSEESGRHVDVARLKGRIRRLHTTYKNLTNPIATGNNANTTVPGEHPLFAILSDCFADKIGTAPLFSTDKPTSTRRNEVDEEEDKAPAPLERSTPVMDESIQGTLEACLLNLGQTVSSTMGETLAKCMEQSDACENAKLKAIVDLQHEAIARMEKMQQAILATLAVKIEESKLEARVLVHEALQQTKELYVEQKSAVEDLRHQLAKLSAACS